MKTVIEVWHTDKNGWRSNSFATKHVDFDETGKRLDHEWWVVNQTNLSIRSIDDIHALRLLLDEIEKDINENHDK